MKSLKESWEKHKNNPEGTPNALSGINREINPGSEFFIPGGMTENISEKNPWKIPDGIPKAIIGTLKGINEGIHREFL